MSSPFARSKALLLVAAALLLLALPAKAEDPAVPVQLQVDLTAKLIEYAEAPSPQSCPVVRIGILTKSGSVESAHFAAELKSAFGRIAKIAGLPHEEVSIAWSSATALASEAKRRQLFAVYVAPGLSSEVPAIASALGGTPILTIGAIDSYVPIGAILGFELASGRPKMVLNLDQAKKQGVSFRASVMKLMRIAH